VSKKLFCYVDETGQDTLGALFVVSVVVTREDRGPLRRDLEAIERSSGKGQVKWHRAKRPTREAHIRAVLSLATLRGKLFYDAYRNTWNYTDEADALMRLADAFAGSSVSPWRAKRHSEPC
jgi:hypothetical protein